MQVLRLGWRQAPFATALLAALGWDRFEALGSNRFEALDRGQRIRIDQISMTSNDAHCYTQIIYPFEALNPETNLDRSHSPTTI
jgi:hypothetical protein